MRRVPSGMAARLGPAARLIAERGFDQTKIEDIAEACGVPKATLYYYFAGKEEILRFLLSDLLDAMTDAVTMAVDAPGTARDRLAGMVEAQLRVMADQPDTTRALISELGRAGRIPELLAAIDAAHFAPARRLLAEGQTDGSLRSLHDPDTVVMSVYGAVVVAGLASLLMGRHLEAGQMAPDVIDLLLHGLAARPPAALPRS